MAVCSSRTLLALLLAVAVAAGCGDDDPAADGDSPTEEEEAVSDPTTTEAGREIFAGATLTLSDRRADRVTLTVTAGDDATIAVVDALVSERHTEPVDGGERVLYLRPPPGTSPGDAQTEVTEVFVVGAGTSLALPSPGGITPDTVEICVEVVPDAEPGTDRQTGDTDLVGRGTIPTQLVCAALGEG